MDNSNNPKVGHDDVRAFLENLTGPSRGRITWLTSDQTHISIGSDRLLKIGQPSNTQSSSNGHAKMTWSEGTYEIEALSESDIWVNRHKITTAHLVHGDIIEFGDYGPMSRFRLCGAGFPTSWPVEEIHQLN